MMSAETKSLEQFFAPFRANVVGNDQTYPTPFGDKRILYADWTASGRLYTPIERKLLDEFGPFVANTHSESSYTGAMMTHAYHLAHHILKQHVNAGARDVIITAGAGMTSVVNKFQRILGLKLAEQLQEFTHIPDDKRPVVFVTHMEHHSNQTSWLETIADVEVIPPDEQGLVCVEGLIPLLEKYKNRPVKIGAFTGCSNVTGIETPYHDLARIMHQHGGVCFVDFAASGPYVKIDMHPAGDPSAKLDAVYFSPHKFLGGPGTPGVLVFDASLYKLRVPDQPGGGTVNWTNPWKQHSYADNIEVREDGGTPGFLQTIKAALAVELKDQMGAGRIREREEQLLPILFDGFRGVPGLHLLAGHITHRLGIISLYLEQAHYNLVVRLLSDRYGIQARGGCSCAGTYGHYLLHVDPQRSHSITDKIEAGDLSEKPGWVRLSIHPTTTDDEARQIVSAMSEIAQNAEAWAKDYTYNPHTNEFAHNSFRGGEAEKVKSWFVMS